MTSLPDRVHISDPWVSRYFYSHLLGQSDGPAGSDVINTTDLQVFGGNDDPIRFRIGNGGAGYTGILRVLAEKYIAENGGDFRIGWVSNHSRHSQIALLSDVVHVALTYEPENEDFAIQEGWASRAGRAFNDHFILVGPKVDLGARDINDALRAIVEFHAAINDDTDDGREIRRDRIVFHTRGDGSATFAKEQALWNAAGIDPTGREWIETHPLPPYQALVKGQADGAFLVTDRATYLTAKQDGVIPSLHVHVQGGKLLLNPCSALVKSDVFVESKKMVKSEETGEVSAGADEAAAHFATWLIGGEAQKVIRNYGKQWDSAKPLFTVAQEEEFEDSDLLTT